MSVPLDYAHKEIRAKCCGKTTPAKQSSLRGQKTFGPAFPIKTPPLGNLPPREGDYFVINLRMTHRLGRPVEPDCDRD
jgi:hypothetical protein